MKLYGHALYRCGAWHGADRGWSWQLRAITLSAYPVDERVSSYACATGGAILTTPGTLLGEATGSFMGRYRYTNLYIWTFVEANQGIIFMPFVPVREEAK